MAQAAEPPSGTRDFLAEDVRRRKAAFDTIGAVFERYGFDPLETPAFERLEVFAGKLGEEASSLIFKILKRGILAIQTGGEADQRGLDVALTVLGAHDDIMRLAAQIRAQGLRTGVYLGSSGKLAKQLKWAHDQHARTVLIYGPDEQQAREVTVRDMESGEQTRVPLAEVGAYLHDRI